MVRGAAVFCVRAQAVAADADFLGDLGAVLQLRLGAGDVGHQ